MDSLLPLLILAVPFVWALATYNGFVRKRNRWRTAFSSIDVNLKKRHDLIPNLVAAVKGYMRHEAGLLERVTQLRERAQGVAATDPGRVVIEREIGATLGAIALRMEAYPDLKASANVLHLQRTLNEIEEQISAARRAFNAAAEEFNNGVEMFPSRIIAGMMSLERVAYFEAVETDRVAPAVDLDPA